MLFLIYKDFVQLIAGTGAVILEKMALIKKLSADFLIRCSISFSLFRIVRTLPTLFNSSSFSAIKNHRKIELSFKLKNPKIDSKSFARSGFCTQKIGGL